MVNKKSGKKDLTVNERKAVLTVLSALTMRAEIASRLGKSFSDKRDLYEALGYNKNPTFNDYMARYKRQDIASAIIDAPVGECWRRPPQVTESLEEETEFEKTWTALVEAKGIYHFLPRVDRLASIGHYAVLLMGFDDGKELNVEVKSAKKLLFLVPYSEQNATIATSVNDTKNERYGWPETYSISMKSPPGGDSGITKQVHWSRVIHVAEGCLEDNVLGSPGLESVLNRLQDIELLLGGSAEMFWRGAFPGYGFNIAPDATIGEQDLTNLKDEIEDYMHGLKRYLRLRGVDVESLAQQVADPSNHVSVQIDAISCAKRIPKRILLGSERGELASSQDEKAWMDHIDERRRKHCEPMILRPLIDRLIKVGVLPPPKEKYTAIWPDLMIPSEKEKAEVGEIRSRTLGNFVNAIGAESVVPISIFQKKMLGFSQEEITQMDLIREQEDENTEDEHA